VLCWRLDLQWLVLSRKGGADMLHALSVAVCWLMVLYTGAGEVKERIAVQSHSQDESISHCFYRAAGTAEARWKNCVLCFVENSEWHTVSTGLAVSSM